MRRKSELTKEELEMYIRAIMENTIYSKDLLAEALPLLEECFIGEFKLTENYIVWEMLNGQKFKITIEEISGEKRERRE